MEVLLLFGVSFLYFLGREKSKKRGRKMIF
jgi:hypothetical protein